MRSKPGFFLAALAVGCASAPVEPAAAPRVAARSDKKLDPAWRPGSMPIKVGEESHDDDVGLEGGRGTLEQRDVDAAVGKHLKALVACGEQAGAARRYLAGPVALRFFVTTTGEVSNV